MLHQANSVDESKLIQRCQKHTLQRVCRLLKLNRSSIYRHKQATPVKALEADKALIERICHLFKSSGKNYGSRRIQHALLTTWRRKFIKTTHSKHNMKVAENVLNQEFNPTTANQAWVADMRSIASQDIWTASGWLYLAAVMDLYSRKIVGYSLSHRMTSDLVCTYSTASCYSYSTTA